MGRNLRANWLQSHLAEPITCERNICLREVVAAERRGMLPLRRWTVACVLPNCRQERRMSRLAGPSDDTVEKLDWRWPNDRCCRGDRGYHRRVDRFANRRA